MSSKLPLNLVRGFLCAVIVIGLVLCIQAVNESPAIFSCGLGGIIVAVLLLQYWPTEDRDMWIDKRYFILSSFLLWTFLLGLLLVPSNYDTLYLPWDNIPIILLMRAVAAVMITSFLPGLGLVIRVRQVRDCGLLCIIITSIVTSQVISALLNFVAFLFGLGTNVANGFLIIVNIIGLVSLLTESKNSMKSISVVFYNPLQLFSMIILLSITIITIISVNATENFLVPTIDQWYHFGWTLRVIEQSPLVLTQAYYILQFYYAQVLMLSGIPYCNAYLLLLFQPIIHILAFYLVAESVSRRLVAFTSSVVYSLFMGAGGVSALVYNTLGGYMPKDAALIAGAQNSDIMYSTYSWFFFVLPKSYGLTIVFLCLVLIMKVKSFNFKSSILIGILLFCGYIWHMSECLFFFLISPFLIIFFLHERSKKRGLGLAILTATVLILTYSWIEIIAKESMLLNSNVSLSNSLLMYIVLITAGLIILVKFQDWSPESVQEKIESIWNKITLFIERRRGFMVSIIAIFVISLVGIYFSEIFSQRTPNFGSIVPLFLYPSKFGIALLLSIVGILLFPREKVVYLGTVLAISTVILSKMFIILFIHNSLHLMTETRFLEFFWPWISLITGLVIAKIIIAGKRKPTSVRRQFIITVLIMLIIGIGIAGKSYEVYWFSNSNKSINPEDLKGLEYSLQLEKDGTMISPGDGYRIIRSFTNVPVVNLWNEFLFESTSPFVTYDIFSHNRMSLLGYAPNYLYVYKESYIQNSYYDKGYLMNHLSNYLQIEYDDDFSTIYDIPDSVGPSSNASILLLVSDALLDSEDYFYLISDMLAIGKYSYNLCYDVDIGINTDTRFLMGTDSSLLNNTAISAWIKAGGVYCLLNIVKDDTVQNWTECDRVNSRTISLALEKLAIPENTSKILPGSEDAWYEADNKRVYPLSSHVDIGLGRVYYIEIWPYLEDILAKSNLNEGRLLFSSIGKILQVSIPIFQNQEVTSGSPRALAWSNVTIEGTIEISSKSLYLPEYISISSIEGNNASTSFEWRKGEVSSLTLVGDYEISITSPNIIVKMDASTPYSILQFPEGGEISIRFSSYGYFDVEFVNDSSTMNMRINRGNLKININSENDTQQVLVRSPHFHINGNATFDSLLIDSSGYYADRVPTNCNGILDFSISSTDKMMSIENFSLSGIFNANRHTKVESLDNIIMAVNTAFDNPYYMVAIASGGIFLSIMGMKFDRKRERRCYEIAIRY